MTLWRKRLGSGGERYAARYLRRKGYRIMVTNWKSRSGEVDIVARDRQGWAFIEVKTRTQTAYGSPAQAVTRKKLKRMIKVAQAYLIYHRLTDVSWRVEVLVLLLDDDRNLLSLEHIRPAMLAWED